MTTGSDHADAIIVASVAALPLVAAIALLLRLSPLAACAVCLLATISSSPLVYLTITTQPDEAGRDRAAIREVRWKSFFREWASLKSKRDGLARELVGQRKLKEQIFRATLKVEEISALLAIDLRILSGQQFEQYLQQAFRVLGYAEVVQTGTSGDQRVDLIVGDGTERVAIQAKCYQGTVGNEAVQQV